MFGRMWIGPVGGVPIGEDEDGTPITATPDGVGPMTLLGAATVTLVGPLPPVEDEG